MIAPHSPCGAGLRYGLWAAGPLLVALLATPRAGLPAWAPALAITVWAVLLARRPEQSLPLAARRSAVLVISLLGGRYLIWRIGSTLNLTSAAGTALSLTMLAAELILLVTGLLQLWLAWARQPPVAEEAAAAERALQRRIAWQPAQVPSVDVLVPSRGEPLELIERCLRGCLGLDYPRHLVWLLDDSGRESLRLLCRQLGCRYLSRPDHSHAKAGNLNHALPWLTADLLVVFDADVVPRRSFLRRTVGLFDDPLVGFVQTPQSSMNADPVMRNLRLEPWLMPDEESFYRWIEPTRQAMGAVVCAGTSFVMRRSALLQVGGFETGTPSEDLATGIRLAAAGYRNLYLDSKLSAGLAPLSIAAMALQRCRWAGGTLQTLRTGASPLSIPGLTPWQRIAYLEGILHWFNVVPQLVLLLMPLSFGLLGVLPIVVRGSGLLSMALPFYLSQLLLVRWFSRGARNALLPELYRWIFLMPLVTAVLGAIAGRPPRFRVTPKTLAPAGQRAVDPGLLVPLLLLLGLQGLNLALLIVRPGAFSFSSQALGLSWAALGTASLLLALRTCWDRPQEDAIPWFSLDAPLVQLRGERGLGPARILAISEQGVELVMTAEAELGAPAALLWPGLDLPPLPLHLERIQPGRRGCRIGRRLGCRWAPLSHSQSEALDRLLYRGEGTWPRRQAPFEPFALVAVLAQLLRPVPPQGWFRRSVLPGVAR
ncbi:glycosyltransferase [Synechococcus sp. CS-1325]|uniref:glycosyltransferase family 2 protein n=1 Tax=Synechococcus sp. CS-1325 TaxID=2847979 RepID=UPI000DB6F61A|nr:glycosyltransferase [Synechococcus sp. CS-1325]MCT0198648.1 glycosyltransferase [Synechococcus sp. CS-1325]PZV02108.1 MAG: glycosyl transferase [Cyanobium sp.]